MGLPYLADALTLTDKIIEQIKVEINTVASIFKTIKLVFDFINHPIDTLTKMDQSQKDSIVDFLDPAIRRHLAPVTHPVDAQGNVQKFGDIGPSGGGDENISGWGVRGSVYDSFRRSEQHRGSQGRGTSGDCWWMRPRTTSRKPARW